MKKLYSTKDILKKIKDEELTHIFDDELIVDLFDDMSRNTFERVGKKQLLEFENQYVSILNDYFKKEYKLNTNKLKSINTNEIKKISEHKNDLYVQLLLNVNSIFSYCSHWLSITSIEQLSALSRIIRVNLSPLISKKLPKNDLVDLLSEIPYLLQNDLKKQRLLLDFAGSQITITRGIPNEGNIGFRENHENTDLMKVIPLD